MNLREFLSRVIDKGIEAAKRDYDQPGDADRLRGSLAGFEACRDKTPDELMQLLQEATRVTSEAHRREDSNYWETRSREAEIEWVCNVMSVVLVQNGFRQIVPPTASAMMTAHKILSMEGTLVVRDELPYPGLDLVMKG